MEAVQIKMARAALGWGVRDLAEAAKLTPATVSRIENGSDPRLSTMATIQRVLEAAGIEFINRDGIGVILKTKEKT